MFKNLPLFIAIRYIFSKKNNKFISIISTISFLGISLGVAVLITVMSVMNGFDEQIKNRILKMTSPLKVYEIGDNIKNWKDLSKVIESKIPEIKFTAPLVEGQGLLSTGQSGSIVTAFVQVQGIDPDYQNRMISLTDHIVEGDLFSLKKDYNGQNIVLGSTLANNLGVTIGDNITMIVPKTNITSFIMIPRIKQFKVSGIFAVSYQYDAYYAMINIKAAQNIFGLGDYISSLQLSIDNVYSTPSIKNKLNDEIMVPYLFAKDWIDENKLLFDALKMEKNIMFFILLLIIMVAVFNLFSSLVMLVMDKRSDIAILRTMGMSSRHIITLFIYQGLIIGFIGTAFGVLLGSIFSIYATDIVNFIQEINGHQMINANIYMLDYVPSKLMWSDIFNVSILSLIFSFLATLYPSWNASRIEPIEVLKYG